MGDLALRKIIEAMLFVAETPLSLERIYSLLEEFEREEIRRTIDALTADCIDQERGIELVQVAGGYQYRSRPELSSYINRMKKAKPVKFSQSAMETLAIVAYRQPVTRAEIEYLRGVDSGGILKSLLDRKLIRIIGKKDIPGKPLIYGTTKEFMEAFSLKDLASLPTLREIEELVDDGSSVQEPLPCILTEE